MYSSTAEQVVYNLLTRHGQQIDFIRLIKLGDFDPATGRQAPSQITRHRVMRAVVLDSELVREFGATLGAPYGGVIDHTQRMVLIPTRSLRAQFKPDFKDRIEFDDERWIISTLELSAPIAGYVIIVKRDPSETGVD